MVEESNYDFKCFPNPSNEQFIFSWKGQDIQSLEIYNYNGQLIDELELINSPQTVNTVSYPNGFYLLKINIDKQNSFFYVKHLVRH